MRVIAGSHRGRRLVAPDTADTRPVTDRVKEAVFSSLGGAVVDAHVLDLYAGAGSFGIEAMSRGAAAVVFVETGRKALGALRTNLEDLGLVGTVVARPVTDYVSSTTDVFDLVFCDPPWPLASDDLATVLEHLAPHLAGGALVIVSRRSSDDTPRPDGYAIDDERRYGDTRIIRYEKREGS